jgi:hypothetical protein
MRTIGIQLSSLIPSLLQCIFIVADGEAWDARPLPLNASEADFSPSIDSNYMYKIRKLTAGVRSCLSALTSMCHKQFSRSTVWETSVSKSVLHVNQIATGACGTANTDVKAIMDLAQLIVSRSNSRFELIYELNQVRHTVSQLIGAIQSTREPIGKASVAPSAYLQLVGISQMVATSLEKSLDLAASLVFLNTHTAFARREHDRKQQQPVDQYFWEDPENENIWSVNLNEIEQVQGLWPEKTGTMNTMIMTLTQVTNHGM